MATVVSKDINLILNVYSKEKYFPLTGTYSTEEDISGFIYNRTKPLNSNISRNDLKTTIGGFEYNLIEGTLNDQWDGGVISGCELNKIQVNSTEWIPELKTGEYTVFDSTKHFYSSRSSSIILTEETTNIPLNSISTLDISLYKRDNEFNNIPFIKYNFVNEDFGSGYEYQIQDNAGQTNIIVNDIAEAHINLIESIAVEERTLENYKAFSESKGSSIKDSYRVIYSNYFPIKPESLKLYSYSGITEEFEEWVLVDNVFQIPTSPESNAPNERLCFDVDYTKGIIRTTGFFDDKKYYVSDYNEEKDTFYLSESINHWPDVGSFSFYTKGNDELISVYNYNGRKKNILNQVKKILVQIPSLIDTFSGYIKFNKTGYTPSLLANGSPEFDFFISYIATPLIEYEADNNQEQLIRKQPDLNLKPIYLNRSNGIIQISPSERHVASISLVCDKNLVSDIYGPLFFGIDQTLLSATCFNTRGQTVSGIEVTFKNIIDDPYINFEGLSNLPIVKITNRFGKASVSANVPYDESLMMITTKQTNNTSLLIDTPDRLRNLSEMTIFQTLRYNGKEKIEDPQAYMISFLSDETGDYPPMVDRLLYTWDESLNLYTKIKALSFINSELKTNATNELPSCYDPVNKPDSLVYQYKIFFSRTARIQATCVDPATGSTIYSNIIDIKLELPLHLKGVNSLNIPYGFGIKSYIDNEDESGDNLRFLGTGLGGANFLTINPDVENIFNLKLQ